MGRYAFLILAIGLAALAGCGKRERVTTLTTVRTVTPAPIAPLTAGGVEAASASGLAPEGASGTTSGNQPSTGGGVAGQGANAPAANGQVAAANNADPTYGTKRTGRVLLSSAIIGLGGAAATEYAGLPPWGLADANGGAVAASGQQCSNPFGGAAAADGQGICSDQGERLACQCTDEGCKLFHSNVMACAPTGTVVN